jgi:hypothetical protein
MRHLKFLALLAVLFLPAAYSQAQVSFGVQIGPSYGFYNPPPVCEYGFYSYYPYDCAPYGYWGPSYFVDGVFIGVGPWSNFYYRYPGFYRPYYFNSFGFHDGFHRFHGDDHFFHDGFRTFHGDDHFHDGFRSFHNDGRFRNDGHGYRADNHFRGGTEYRAFNGNGPGFRDGGSRSYNGAGRSYSGGGQSHYSGRSYGGGGSYSGGSHSSGSSRGGGGGSRNGGGHR